MQAAPARYVSVSDLYSTDEVELLLEEIRDLEPTSCRGEDVQDFEIAGSGCGGAGGAGGRSPAGTELTERSWDSHAQYRRAPPPRPRPLAPVYCRLRYLCTLRGALTLIIVVCCTATCACVWAGAGLRLAGPLAGRLRPLQLAALSSALQHAALLAMHVTRLRDLMPIDWDKLGACTSVWSGASLCAGGALALHALLASDARPALADLLYSAAALGLCGACASWALVSRWAATRRGWRRARRGCSERSSARAAYRAVPPAPAAPAAPAAPPDDLAPQPSTSRADPL